MGRLSIYRSVHSLRVGETHKPARAIELDDAAIAALRPSGLERDKAFSGEALTELRRQLEAERRFLRSSVVADACKRMGRAQVDDEVRVAVEAQLAADVRFAMLERTLELAREAEQAQMTLVLSLSETAAP
jgi:hypothetical protein